MIRTQTTIRTRYAETDQMGFVHHQNYIAYFEQARVEMLTQIGTPYRQLENDGYFLPVLEVNVQYLQPNTFDDELIVHCILETMPSVKIFIKYEIYRGDVLTTTGYSHHGFMKENGKPSRPPHNLIEAAKPFFKGEK